MDPITLILSALAAGAAASIKETAGTAVKDAYNGLKALIQRKFAENPKAQLVLSEYEEKPEVWKPPLEEEIKKGALAEDQEILAAAQQLMTQVQAHQVAQGKYNIQITGSVQGLAQGDYQHVTMNFGQPPQKD